MREFYVSGELEISSPHAGHFGSKCIGAIMPRQARSNLGLWGSIRSSFRSVLLPGEIRLPGVEAARASLGWDPTDIRSPHAGWTAVPVHGLSA